MYTLEVMMIFLDLRKNEENLVPNGKNTFWMTRIMKW